MVRRMDAFSLCWSLAGLALVGIFTNGVTGFDEMDLFNGFNDTSVYEKQENGANVLMDSLLFKPLLPKEPVASVAVCQDGSVPGYHLYPGYGSGANNWFIHLQGGAWCDSVKFCQYRKRSSYGSSTLMEKVLAFTGILSNKASENPDFYHWDKVKVRYCDGAFFNGDSENKLSWKILMAKGMRQAKQGSPAGCSAGGL
ncbi:LOW QUALITY PROTEIN: hypothetical protein HID58_021132 [Brassica napus]|uniref:Pectin acetylesterase n=1 Tax=Brassica napus TaxID=3708 RepID=A0ABQ8CVK9_BRANA|nr:LOW QUALITY PROTEIN: hypothetical protein HID58_021132 [Brassica napus]